MKSIKLQSRLHQSRFGSMAPAVRHIAAPAAVRGSQLRAITRDDHWRTQLCKDFPNSLLLAGSRLPSLYDSKHFVNLTNGLELAPLLQRLHLPFSVVRIRSTCLEQQLFEALMLELDANLLLALALGHSCIIWDCGCRNRSNGAPRAVWYGVEFIRFALHRFWLGSAGPAHLRGFNVAADFEAACKRFHPSTKKRLRYYQRFLTPQVKQHGIQLFGLFRRTENDEDVQYYVGMAWEHCGRWREGFQVQAKQQHGTCFSTEVGQRVPEAAASTAIHSGKQLQDETAPNIACADGGGEVRPQPACLQSWGCDFSSSSYEPGLTEGDFEAYELLLSEDIGMFTAGLSHQQFIEVKPALGSG